LCGRSLRVDHVENYRLPKHLLEKEEQLVEAIKSSTSGHAYYGQELASEFDLENGLDLFAPVQQRTLSTPAKTLQIPVPTNVDRDKDDNSIKRKAQKRKHKEEKLDKRKHKAKGRRKHDRIDPEQKNN
jgi:hypothetical protein